MARKLALSEYTNPQTTRKDIYAYLHALVKQLLHLSESQSSLKKLLGDCEPNWTAVRKAVEAEEERIPSDWGIKPFPERVPTPRAEDVVRKHEPGQSKGLNILDKGAASTTKKIIQSSVQSRKKMMMFDDALQ